jgi:hypothetical protein
MRSRAFPLALLSALAVGVSVGGCDEPHSDVVIVPPDHDGGDASSGADAAVADIDNRCEHAFDSVCDEPLNCELGTDQRDCAAACADSPGAHLFGACRFLQNGLPDHYAVSDEMAARGSNGVGGRSGRWYGVVDAAGPDPFLLVERHFSVYVPHSYHEARPAPVIYYGGGFGDEMYHTIRYTDLEALAERHGIIIAYVQQDHRDFGRFNYQMAWYVYRNAFAGNWKNCPDLDFYEKVLEQLKSSYNVDRTRVYLTGTSRGGGISIMLAFIRPDLFTGFISQAGFIAVNEFGEFIERYRGRKMAAVLIAGNQDDNVEPWESEQAAELLEGLGWGDQLLYLPIEGAGHQWQTHLTQRWWDFVYNNPIPLEEAEP